jgi:outer membrane receptor for ferric coprogen and ferric-rhodotorulic acid
MNGYVLTERSTGRRAAVCGAWLLMVLALGGISPAPLLAQTTTAAPRTFDIPAQPLREALLLFGQQSGLQVTAQGPLVEAKTSTAIAGEFTPAAALGQLLTGTGLTFRFNGADAVEIEPAPQSSDSAVQLGPVRVGGESAASGIPPGVTSSDPEATEGTGAYTPVATRSATGLPLSLRETPQSVTVITSQQLEDRGITGLADAMETTTGVRVVASDFTRPTLYSRGLAVSNLQVDGHPMFSGGQGLSSIQSDNMIAYDRIEVLRGANGLLTGPGDPSGTVTMIRKRPTREFQAHGQASLGSWNNPAGEADVSGPLTPSGTVRGRVAAGLYDSDNFIEHSGRNGKALLAVVEADLTPHTVARVGYQYDQYKIEGLGFSSAVPLWFSNGQPYNAPRSLNREGPRDNVTDQRARSLYAGLEHEFGNDWAIQGTVDLSRRKRSRDPGVFYMSIPTYPDPSGLGATLNTDVPYPVDDRQWAYNVDAQGPVTLFGREHQLIVGATGWDQTRRVDDELSDISGQPPADFVATYPTLSATDWSLPYPSWLTGFPRSKQYTAQHGAFAAARWNLADSLKLITGARVTNWKTSTDLYDGQTGVLTQADSGAYSVRREITPYVGAVWDFHPNLSAYASYADIFKPQNLYDADDNLLEPIVGKNYEVGLKGEFLDKQLNASLAVFRMVQDNLGERDPNFPDDYETPGGNTPYRSAGKGITTNGFEAEISGALRPGWNSQAGYTYAKSTKATGEPYNPDLPVHLLRVFTTYEFQGHLSGVTLGIGGSWNSSISRVMQRPTGAYKANGQPVTADYEFRQGSVLPLAAMARYRVTSKLSLLLNVDNLLDQNYYNTASSSSGPTYATPRRWRATLRYQF